MFSSYSLVLSLHVQLSPKSPNLLSPEDGVSAAVESYNPRGSASFIEQRQAAKECKFGEVTLPLLYKVSFNLNPVREEEKLNAK